MRETLVFWRCNVNRRPGGAAIATRHPQVAPLCTALAAARSGAEQSAVHLGLFPATRLGPGALFSRGWHPPCRWTLIPTRPLGPRWWWLLPRFFLCFFVPAGAAGATYSGSLAPPLLEQTTEYVRRKTVVCRETATGRRRVRTTLHLHTHILRTSKSVNETKGVASRVHNLSTPRPRLLLDTSFLLFFSATRRSGHHGRLWGSLPKGERRPLSPQLSLSRRTPNQHTATKTLARR